MSGGNSERSFIGFLAITMAGIFFFTDVNRYVNNPHHSYIHVTHASLAEFNRITTATINTLHYNLVLHITLQNPNKDFDVYYDNIVVMAYYQNQRFIMESYSHVVYQGKNDTNRLKLSLKGQQDMDNTLGVVEEGHQENSKVEQPHHQCIHDDNGDEKNKKFRSSEYDIFVRLYLQNTAIPNPRSLIRMNWIGNSQFTCNLKRVPLITTANYNASHFMTAECNSDFYRVFHPPGSG